MLSNVHISDWSCLGSR